MTLTKQLRGEIQQLGQRLQTAANAEELFQRKSARAQDKAQHALELKQIAQAIRKLLTRIEDAVPLINLAITASGASLSSILPTTVSPSRLLQASTFLTAGDSQYANSTSSYMQIGPTFTLSIYMLFAGHIRSQSEDDIRESTWKEVIHKAIVRLMRVPIDALYVLPGGTRSEPDASHLSPEALDRDYFPGQMAAGARADEYAYQLVIVEDLNDDRIHTFEDGDPQPGPYGDIDLAGIRESVPIHELSKIFYADTGKILNIGSEGEANSPVLLLKRDLNAMPPRRTTTRCGGDDDIDDTLGFRSSLPRSPATSGRQNSETTSLTSEQAQRSTTLMPNQSQQHTVSDTDPWRLPADLDPEWIAFEVYTEAEGSDTETEDESTPFTKPSRPSRTPSTPATTSALSCLNVNTPPTSSSSSYQQFHPSPQRNPSPHTFPAIRTSLSLLETLLRLLSLQQFQQTPHLSIPDELLTFFLSESASTGAASNDVQERKRLREEARRRVGFDPYDESPVKRRGEDYQYRNGGGEGGWDSEARDRFTDEQYRTPIESARYEDEGYDTHNATLPPLGGQTPSMPHHAASDTPADRWYRKTPPGTAMSGSTGQSLSPAGRQSPLLTRRSDGGKYGLRDTSSRVAVERKGSPPVRPGTGLTDEGLGTSPSVEEDRKG